MKARQKGALKHPITHTALFGRSPKQRIEYVRNRTTILTVSEVAEGVWVWHASVSYQKPDGSGEPMPLGEWTEQRARKADRELRSLLDGVGEHYVFGIMPRHADVWNDLGFEDWDVIDAGDVLAGVHPDFLDFPMPPTQFSAAHLWRTLTQDELAQVLGAVRN